MVLISGGNSQDAADDDAMFMQFAQTTSRRHRKHPVRQRPGSQSPERRIPGHAVARTAHAADGHPGLGATAADANARSRRNRPWPGNHRAQRLDADQTDRRSAGHLPDRGRQTAAEHAIDRLPFRGAGRGRRRGPADRLPSNYAWNCISAPGRPRCTAIRNVCNRSSGTCSATPSNSRPAKGRMSVELAGNDDQLELHVSDTGQGIAPVFCRMCSTASGKPTARRPARTAGWESAWRWCGTSSKATAESSRPKAKEKGKDHNLLCGCR